MSRTRTVSCPEQPSSGSLSRSLQLFLNELQRAIEAYRAYRKRNQRMRCVARLDDHLLRDIGLEREDVVEAQPFVTGYEGLEIEVRRRR